MQQQMNTNLSPYVTSSFQRHGLTAMSGIVARLVAGVSQLPFAKIVNIWGRAEGYLLAHFLCSLGKPSTPRLLSPLQPKPHLRSPSIVISLTSVSKPQA